MGTFSNKVTFTNMFLVLLFSGVGLVSGIGFYLATNPFLDLSALVLSPRGQPSVVLDDEGNELCRFHLEQRAPLILSSAPQHLINAFVVAEDHQFFSHHGLSWQGILRAIAANVYHHRFVQGASTITQQLVKLTFFTNQRSLWRKIKEQLTALIVEHQFSKEQILEAYLNQCYFGSGIYGVEAAAERFWNKSAAELSVAQGATLAGIIRNPQRYSPLSHPDAALRLRNVILKSMSQQGAIDQKTYEAASQEPLALQPPSSAQGAHYAPHVRELVRQFLEEQVGKDKIYTGGLTVQTTINRKLQEHAYKTFQKQVNELHAVEPALDGAVVCLDTATASIKALIGGLNQSSAYNRARASRQMGSMFKPIVYTAAIEAGYSFARTAIDEPIEYQGWAPHNVGKNFEGEMTLAHALIVSNNIVPVKLFFELGGDTILACAARFHLPPQGQPYPSLALGCAECTPLEAAAMYATFVNRGVHQEPHLIEWVKDASQKKIWRHQPVTEPATSWEVSGQVLAVLQLTAAHVQERLNRSDWPQGDCAGKTGTSNDNRSCWFAGITPKLTCVVYLGCDDNRPMENRIFSLWHAAPLWLAINQPFVSRNQRFFYSPLLEPATIHQKTGEPVEKNNPDAITILCPRTS